MLKRFLLLVLLLDRAALSDKVPASAPLLFKRDGLCKKSSQVCFGDCRLDACCVLHSPSPWAEVALLSPTPSGAGADKHILASSLNLLILLSNMYHSSCDGRCVQYLHMHAWHDAHVTCQEAWLMLQCKRTCCCIACCVYSSDVARNV